MRLAGQAIPTASGRRVTNEVQTSRREPDREPCSHAAQLPAIPHGQTDCAASVVGRRHGSNLSARPVTPQVEVRVPLLPYPPDRDRVVSSAACCASRLPASSGRRGSRTSTGTSTGPRIKHRSHIENGLTKPFPRGRSSVNGRTWDRTRPAPPQQTSWLAPRTLEPRLRADQGQVRRLAQGKDIREALFGEGAEEGMARKLGFRCGGA